MSAIHELGATVQARRSDMGLTQAALAKISGLSRATVNQLENGSIHDLSLLRVARLLEAIGIPIVFGEFKASQNENGRPKSSPCEIAARSASVSFRIVLPVEQLRESLLGGDLPKKYWPHLHTLLEEASAHLLARVVDELHNQSGTSRSDIWQRMRNLANQFQGTRALWL